MDVKLPSLGEGIEKATVSCWYVSVGNAVEKDTDLVELVTDKATFNVPSPIEGILRKIFFKEGETVLIGQTLALME